MGYPVVVGKSPEVIAFVGTALSKELKVNLGGMFLTVVFTCLFMGILAGQASTYFHSFPKDVLWLKCLAVAAVVLSVIHTIFELAVAWQWLVYGWGSWQLVSEATANSWVTPVNTIVSELVVAVAQLFYVHRCFILTKRSFLLAGLLLGGILACIGLYIALTLQFAYDPFYLPAERRLVIPWGIINSAIDCIITGVTLWKITAARRYCISNLDNTLQRIITVTIEAAIPPTLLAITTTVAFWTMSTHNLLFAFFGILTARVYIFSLFFTLNSRRETRDQAMKANAVTVFLNDSQWEKPEFAPMSFAVSERSRGTDSTVRTSKPPTDLPVATTVELKGVSQEDESSLKG